MSASPFRTTAEPFLEIPVPVTSDEFVESKPLEDVPFVSADKEGQIADGHSPKEKVSWFSKLFVARTSRRLREEKLVAEVQELRASYAGLLNATEDIREIKESLQHDAERRESVQKILSPFPTAMKGIERLQTRQEEAGEILTTIRESIGESAEKDDALLRSMDSLQESVAQLQTGVESVDHVVGDFSRNQKQSSEALSERLGEWNAKMNHQIKEVAQVSQKSCERVEESNGDVLATLRQMEKNSQRGLWIFASLLAIVFITLVCIGARVGQANQVEPPAATAAPQDQSQESLVSTDKSSKVLVDSFDF